MHFLFDERTEKLYYKDMEKEALLQSLYQECKHELEKIDITFNGKEINIQLSKRNNKRYGCCKPQKPDENYKKIVRKGWHYSIKYENFKQYTIEISPWVMQLKEEIIKNTIIHELLHCLPYCNNHGVEFKKYANKIKEKLGYTITTTGNKKEDYHKSDMTYEKDRDYHYKIQCIQCGQILYRKRLARNFIKKYRCGKCKGKLEIVEEVK